MFHVRYSDVRAACRAGVAQYPSGEAKTLTGGCLGTPPTPSDRGQEEGVATGLLMKLLAREATPGGLRQVRFALAPRG